MMYDILKRDLSPIDTKLQWDPKHSNCCTKVIFPETTSAIQGSPNVQNLFVGVYFHYIAAKELLQGKKILTSASECSGIDSNNVPI